MLLQFVTPTQTSKHYGNWTQVINNRYFPQVYTVMSKFLRMPSLALTRYLKGNNIMPQRNKTYPCLCEICKNVIFVARVAGILPIRSVLEKDIRKCSFVTSNYMIAYSAVLQTFYFIYFCFVYSMRLLCSEDKSYKNSDW